MALSGGAQPARRGRSSGGTFVKALEASQWLAHPSSLSSVPTLEGSPPPQLTPPPPAISSTADDFTAQRPAQETVV
jgi:hypothetical protein